MGECPVRYFQAHLSNGNVSLTSEFKYNVVKHHSLSLIACCVACLGGERKAEGVPKTNEG